ncbi:hypothetical protein ACIRL2_23180 [Embleya sp. NPDC127516]|uniref:hypothetical protein n=1 Tax=Embleya sp. NPDC127516 TaxID=3363990 RepID=UPI0037FFC692
MRTSMSRLGSIVITGALLVAATACGSDDDKKDSGKSAAGTPSSAAPSAPSAPIPGTPAAGTTPPAAPSSAAGAVSALTGPQLEKAVLTAADLPQGVYLTRPAAGSDDRATATPADCQPLVDLFLPRQGATKPAAVAQAFVSMGTPIPTGVIGSELFSFSGTDAEAVMAKGRAALKNCGSVSMKDPEGETSTIKHTEIAHPKLGDDTLAITSSPEDGGARASIAIRVGSTLIVISSADLSGNAAKVPDLALVTKQVERITAAAKS